MRFPKIPTRISLWKLAGSGFLCFCLWFAGTAAAPSAAQTPAPRRAHAAPVAARARAFRKKARRAQPPTFAAPLRPGLPAVEKTARQIARNLRKPGKRNEKQEENEAGEQTANEARREWFMFQREYPSGKFPEGVRRLAWNLARPRRDANTPANAILRHWRNVSPNGTNSYFPGNWGKTSGRVNALAVSPADSNLVLAGAATGGIWRSNDGGATWAPVSDDQADLAVGALAFAPSNPSVVYAAMGDIYNSYFGSGVLKSTDAGATWARVSNSATLPEAGFNMKIAVDATDANRVYLAQALYNPRTGASSVNGGFYVSTDGGVNWTRTLAGQARDLAVHPSDPNILYVALRRLSSGAPPGLFKSADKGLTWTLILATPTASPTDTRVAVSPADPQRIYFYTGLSPTVYSSTDGGATWTNRGGAGLDASGFGYNTYIAADPSNANTVYVGARDVYKSTDGGTTWRNLTRSFSGTNFAYTPQSSNAHPDQHALAFTPDNPQTLYLGNDGGVYKSFNGGVNFQSLNATLSLAQAVGFSLHPDNSLISYIGTQDNGTQRRVNGAEWSEFDTGDGGNNVIPNYSGQKVFATYIRGTIDRFGNYGQQFESTVATDTTFGEPASGARIGFYAPFVGNGVDDRLYFGTWRLFISADMGNSWAAPGGAADLTRGGSDVLNAIAVAKANPNFIYTGSRQGRVMMTTDGGANWADITAGLPNRTITSVTVSDGNPLTAWVTVSGFATGHIFRTVDGGASWTDLSGNLLNVPANAVLVDPRDGVTLYVATDVGVYRSQTGGNVWESVNYGLPPVPVTKLAGNNAGSIMAATYGRGVYEAINSLDEPREFVRAQYLDFLNREPEATGWDYWTNEVATCTGLEPCTLQRRVGVSAAFFIEQEFQSTGAYVYRLYRAAYGQRPTFAQFMPDRAQVTAGPDLAQNKLALATAFVNRPAFSARYPLAQTAAQFVDTLLQTVQQSSGINLQSQRAALLNDYETGGRALVIRNLADAPDLAQAEFNRAFVLMQYFGYLRRDPDAGGYDFWLNVLNNQAGGDYRGMVCAFVTATEYQRRFGIPVRHSNADCNR